MELSAESRAEQAEHLASIRVLDVQKRARAMIVPTVIDEVKQMLRERRHPVTLFGENAFDRRERLRRVMAEIEMDREASGGDTSHLPLVAQSSSSGSSTAKEEKGEQERARATYTKCDSDMIAAREFLTAYSFTQAKERIAREAQDAKNFGVCQKRAEELCDKVSTLQLSASAVSEQRPLMKVRFDPSGRYLVSGSMGNQLKIWDTKRLEGCASLLGHEERITGLAWHPDALMVPPQQRQEEGEQAEAAAASSSSGSKKGKRKRAGSSTAESEGEQHDSARGTPSLLASASADGKCLLWDCSRVSASSPAASASLTPSLTLVGHRGPLTGCAFHPAGKHVATSGIDFSWRYWDVTTGKELLLQDGHPSECTSVAFHDDGSLLMSSDSSGFVFLWDLRSGKRILVLEGHADKVTASCFHPNGHEAATASIDNTIRIWDLRKRTCKYVNPAHSEAITDVRYSSSGSLLLSSSFDGAVNVFQTTIVPHEAYYARLASLRGHSGKVMAADFAPDESMVASVGFDRTVKLWTPQ
jgi:U4/U6 small nuclear ribonucleoprotein PRP4